MDDKKRVIAEWVLTNGRLPGFGDRVKATVDSWSTVGESGLIVYRAHGGHVVKSELDPKTILSGVRPVIATSKDVSSIRRYAGKDCCVFRITLSPGVKYIDVNETVTFLDTEGRRALAVKNTVLEEIRTQCPTERTWPTASTPVTQMRRAILDRCLGRTKFQGTEREEDIPPENEIMVYGLDGEFSPITPSGKVDGVEVYDVTYSVKTGGRKRGRTFRRKPKRMNKNGSGPSRKSKHCIGNRYT